MQTKNVGILSVGVYLPETRRRNDHWSPDVVARWRSKAAARLQRTQGEFAHLEDKGLRMALEALAALGDDPFQGLEERRVMSADMTAADMETMAARDAIARAGIDPQQIDLLLSYTMCPDYINVPTGCVVHANLGLREHCQTMAVDAVCNSFIMQLTLAQSMIQSGRARYALLTQSSAITRMPGSGEHYDTWWGDAGTAVIVGPVAENAGIVGVSHYTDGTLHKALVAGVPGKRWFDLGEVIAYSEDHRANFDMIAKIAERSKQVLDDCFAESKVTADKIDFYACHQAFLWLRDVTQRYVGMRNARWVDTFKWAGTVSAANLPLVLATGEREGVLKSGDLVALFQGGTGMTWSGMTLRWGT
ncbi:MAG TPA: 3-oxoacyl-[acyl-carrier-protein] synthase III C-terminal domain-containing protein [Polyangia bacterium]|jgi:3-oxoacyl-[acyl-carrier-protein] synthase-3